MTSMCAYMYLSQRSVNICTQTTYTCVPGTLAYKPLAQPRSLLTKTAQINDGLFIQ